MSKKKRRGRKRGKSRPTFPARFAAGDRVRVRPGTADPDFPDIPLGGWAGTVGTVERRSNPPTYLIEWNEYTLEYMHPVYRKRCARDDVDVTSIWLGEADLEPDTGEPAVMEQPTNIVTRPLRASDRDDRIRAIFGLTSDDPLPPTNRYNLGLYHNHLESHLTFPFQAKLVILTGYFQQAVDRVNVLSLLDPEECGEEDGALCRVEWRGEVVDFPLAGLEGALDPHNRQLVADYAYWFHNWPADAAGPPPGAAAEPFEDDVARPGRWAILKTLVKLGLCGAACGAVLGALLAATEAALTGAVVGAVLLGTIGLIAGAWYGKLLGTVNRIRHMSPVGGVLGTVGGAALGTLLGAMLVAFLGTLGGAVVGGVAGRLVRRNAAGLWVGAALGAGVGAFGQVYYRDAEAALTGGRHGAWVGAATGAILALVWHTVLILANRDRRR